MNRSLFRKFYDVLRCESVLTYYSASARPKTGGPAGWATEMNEKFGVATKCASWSVSCTSHYSPERSDDECHGLDGRRCRCSPYFFSRAGRSCHTRGRIP